MNSGRSPFFLNTTCSIKKTCRKTPAGLFATTGSGHATGEKGLLARVCRALALFGDLLSQEVQSDLQLLVLRLVHNELLARRARDDFQVAHQGFEFVQFLAGQFYLETLVGMNAPVRNGFILFGG